MAELDRRHCYFCPAPPLYTHVALYNDLPPDSSNVAEGDRHPQRGLPLCMAHLEAIEGAMYRGRVHRKTGIRWWYFLFAPQVNRPARLRQAPQSQQRNTRKGA